MATYSQAGKFGPAAISGAPVGVPLRVVDGAGSPAVLYSDASKNKTVGPIVRSDDAGLVTFFADPGTYTVTWTGGSTSVTVTGGTFSPSDVAQPALSALDHSLLAWSMDPFVVPSFGAPTVAGRLEFVRLRLTRTSSVTNIVMMALGAGSGLTAGQNFAALYRSDRTLVAQTADQSTAWASASLKTMPLAGGPYTVDAGDVFVGFWYNGTTSPGWARAANSSGALVNVGLSSPNLRVGSADTLLTTGAPTTMGAQTAAAPTWWAALS